MFAGCYNIVVFCQTYSVVVVRLGSCQLQRLCLCQPNAIKILNGFLHLVVIILRKIVFI